MSMEEGKTTLNPFENKENAELRSKLLLQQYKQIDQDLSGVGDFFGADFQKEKGKNDRFNLKLNSKNQIPPQKRSIIQEKNLLKDKELRNTTILFKRMFNQNKDRTLLMMNQESQFNRQSFRLQSRLNKVSAMYSKEKKLQGGTLSKEMDNQIDEIIDENYKLKDQVKKLSTVVKGIENKQKAGYSTFGGAPKGQKKLTSTVGGRNRSTTRPQSGKPFGQSSSGALGGPSYGSGQKDQMINTLRDKLGQSEKMMGKLNQDVEYYKKLSQGQIASSDVMKQVRDKELEISSLRIQLDEAQQQFEGRQEIFNQNKKYMDEILEELRSKKTEVLQLQSENNVLQMTAGSAKDMLSQLREVTDERNKLERQLRDLYQEPFFKREAGESAFQRVKDLERNTEDQNSMIRKLKEKEIKQEEELQEMRQKLSLLTGENNTLKRENDRVRTTVESRDGMSIAEVQKTLYNLDPTAFRETMKDLKFDGDEPLWAKIDFLEQYNLGGAKSADPNDPRSLMQEIERLKVEKKEIASELEKSQNLVKILNDMERESNNYYEEQIQTLKLQIKAANTKADQMSKLADARNREMMEMRRKGVAGGQAFSYQPRGAGGSPSRLTQDHLDRLEVASDISMISQETELMPDENALEFAVDTGEFYQNQLAHAVDKDIPLNPKTFMTFITVDFYNHDTETTQFSDGFAPNYSTHFSFRNRVDDFYIQHIMKSCVKLDIFVSKAQQAELIGTAQILLRDLLDREDVTSAVGIKTQSITSMVNIQSSRQGNQDVVIGVLKYKMKMRKTISEALRWYRERNELSNLSAQIKTGIQQSDDMRNQKKIVTIEVGQALNLTTKYNVQNIRPFFYYQFYTFEEAYSNVYDGQNPRFGEKKFFDIMYNQRFVQYVQKEHLEVHLLDDSGPIADVGRGSVGGIDQSNQDDFIGTARIPLSELAAMSNVLDKFGVYNQNNQKVGEVEVRISIMDATVDTYGAAGLGVSKQWEHDILRRIAIELAKMPDDINMIYDIFARQQKVVTKERFIQIVRTTFKIDIDERELEIFLRSNTVIREKDYIDRDDFVTIFSYPISQARKEFQIKQDQDQIALRQYELHKTHQSYGDTIQGSPFKQQMYESSNIDALSHGKRLQDILEQVKQPSKFVQFKQTCQTFEDRVTRQMDKKQFKYCLSTVGVSEFDGQYVADQFTDPKSGQVDMNAFYQKLDVSQHIVNAQSVVLQKFKDCLRTYGYAILKKFSDIDINQDGLINQDAFKSVMLDKDYGFNTAECDELWGILALGNVTIPFKAKILEHNPTMNEQMTKQTTIGSAQVNRPAMMAPIVNERVSKFFQSKFLIEEIKRRIKQYMETNDISLQAMFEVVDQNSSKSMDKGEFNRVLKNLSVQLSTDEITDLFQHLDKDSSGAITFSEFLGEFQALNTQYLVNKVKKIISGSGTPFDKVFDNFCMDGMDVMTIECFKQVLRFQQASKMIQFFDENLGNAEIELIFQHFDVGGNGEISKEEFLSAFSREVVDKDFETNIDDILKPLQSRMNERGMKAYELFGALDQDNSRRLSADEIRKAIEKDLKYKLNEDEMITLRKLFLSKFNTPQITGSDFAQIMSTKFNNQSDANQAAQTLVNIRKKLEIKRLTSFTYLQPYDYEQNGNISMRNIKLAVHNLQVANHFEIDNLVRYLDSNNDGFVSITDFDNAVKVSIQNFIKVRALQFIDRQQELNIGDYYINLIMENVKNKLSFEVQNNLSILQKSKNFSTLAQPNLYEINDQLDSFVADQNINTYNSLKQKLQSEFEQFIKINAFNLSFKAFKDQLPKNEQDQVNNYLAKQFNMTQQTRNDIQQQTHVQVKSNDPYVAFMRIMASVFIILGIICVYFIMFHNHAEHVKIYGPPNTADYLKRREHKHIKPLDKVQNFVEDILLIFLRDERAEKYCGAATITILVLIFVSVVIWILGCVLQSDLTPKKKKTTLKQKNE